MIYFIGKHTECFYQLFSCLRRFYNLINKSSCCSIVRVGKKCSIFRFFFLPFLLRIGSLLNVLFKYYFGSSFSTKFLNPTKTTSGRKVSVGERERKKEKRQAGTELCQAQFKLGLVKPAVASHVLASFVS